MNILSRLRSIKIFVFDMDGVLTDGGLYLLQEGAWLRRMNIKDGYALQLAIRSGYRVLVISGSESEPVSERLKKLGVTEIYMKVNNKAMFLREYIASNNCKQAEILYMGDDIPDYECLQMAGLPCCPADAAIDIKQICSYISPLKGGEGCVREVIEKVLKLNSHWPLDSFIASL